MLKGKMAYLSPEVLQGHPADARADIFALGVTFYELLTNQMPFQGEREAVILQAIATQQPKDPREWNPSLDPDLSAIVFRAATTCGRRMMSASMPTIATRVLPSSKTDARTLHGSCSVR